MTLYNVSTVSESCLFRILSTNFYQELVFARHCGFGPRWIPDSMSEVETPESHKIQRAGRQPDHFCVSQVSWQELKKEFLLYRHMALIWGGQLPDLLEFCSKENSGDLTTDEELLGATISSYGAVRDSFTKGCSFASKSETKWNKEPEIINYRECCGSNLCFCSYNLLLIFPSCPLGYSNRIQLT